MTVRRLSGLTLCVALVACGGGATPQTSPTASLAAATATAAPVADYKDGDTLTVIVPYSAGGGFDVGARLLQPFLQTALKKVTTKDVSVIVQNVTGAGGQVGVEQLYRAEPDGRRVVYTTQVDMAGFQTRGSPIDIRKLTPIAQIADQTIGWIVRPGVIPENGTFKDLADRSKVKPILYGYTAPDQAKLTIALLKDAMDFRVDPVAFPGTGDAVASLVRNEIEVYTVSLSTALQQVQAHPTWRIVVQSGDKRDSTAPSVPTFAEAGIPKTAADQLNVMAATTTRTVHGPPGVSAGNTKALQDAFRLAIEDPAFVKSMTDKSQPVKYADAKIVLDTANAAIDLFTKYRSVLIAP
jgi:tripartite-type tricarboxylate transporter receptor subunit TctC